jgi:hypothetical protein
MAQVRNLTPFSVELLVFPDASGQEISLLVISACFTEDSSGLLAPWMSQPPVRVADEHFGDPASSSIRHEADVALCKPFVDVIVNGSVHAPNGEPTVSVVVELHVADLHKKLRVQGDRKRSWLLLGAVSPFRRPFQRMPIIYERAFGGTDSRSSNPKRHKTYRWNPVGTGFRRQLAKLPGIDSDGPNIADIGARYGFARKSPAGFGVIGRSWPPRINYAGTYDAKWLKNQWPLLPADFDPRYNQCAPEDQQSRTILGGEEVRLVNLTPEGEWRFRLPKLDVPIHLFYDDRQVEASPRLDTVIMEPDLRCVMLSARLAIPVERARPPLREIVLGHVSKGWLRAKFKRKRYRDPLGTDGAISHQANYK